VIQVIVDYCVFQIKQSLQENLDTPMAETYADGFSSGLSV
jgi:hypothetical protein